MSDDVWAENASQDKGQKGSKMKVKDTNQALDTPGPSLERLQLLHATRERLESSRAGSGVQRRLLEIISSAVGIYEPDPISGRKVVCFERVKELGLNEVLLGDLLLGGSSFAVRRLVAGVAFVFLRDILDEYREGGGELVRGGRRGGRAKGEVADDDGLRNSVSAFSGRNEGEERKLTFSEAV